MTPEIDLEALRLLPLNQVAALKLRAAGESLDPGSLPVFQLMTWGVAQGVRCTHRRTLEELESLQSREPKNAFAYLTANLPGGLLELERRLLQLPPRAAALVLLDVLDLRLKADPRNPYPSG